VAVVLAVTGGCSVPALSLDGKECPCTDGYLCDTLTNRCLRTNDGGTIIDTPAATNCTASLANELELYRYTGTYDWIDRGGSWSGTATEIRQTDKMANAFSYRSAANLNVTNVRVISSMRETDEGNGGTPSLGITLRTTLDGTTRYRCMWTSGTRQLSILRDDTTLGAPVTIPAGTMLPATFTMEATAIGSTLGCCIRELPTARLSGVIDTAIANGFAGLEAQRKAVAYGSFVVFGAP
jgi:hypothetical protein